MPLKRTPPKVPTVSGTSTQCVGGSDETSAGNQSTIINTGRIKNKRENELSNFMEEMRDMFSKLAADQKLKMERLESSLKEIKSQNNEINQSISTLSAKYDELQHEIEYLRQERKENNTYIKLLENKIENFEKQTCVSKLEIRNIPKFKSETKNDLCNAVKKIGTSLNLQLQSADIRDVYRPFAKPGAAVKPIVVDFTSVLTKEKFLKNMKKLTLQEKSEKLNSGLFGETPQIPIYISECLTPKGRRIFYLARDFASSNNYTYCWTAYGKIYIRQKEGMPHIRIEEEADLTRLKTNTP